ncbi:hypothetical protein CBM2633_A70237 [Cupriavidus taiwanensis]|nr:hypothetical protein CBM2604_A80236 [Cupriavidus taiwanensis]SOZ22434.1 hypothetical protein CBM2609_A100240 [Cupriavidus taiwanensis]SOZ41945.1 hypothetical protein CBM2610_A100236 [Cupriavidus taiwanensis]SOZ97829.1 hypothetical protein CBM2626_A130175 [Cupriavidus taiwanensis]SPA16186.1 hypothetical protein CBM2633_A70237 [Cupriavidus taiwanensis]
MANHRAGPSLPDNSEVWYGVRSTLNGAACEPGPLQLALLSKISLCGKRFWTAKIPVCAAQRHFS